MAKKETNETIGRLIAYWQLHRGFNANIANLARYARVSRDTVYRWLNRKAYPKKQAQGEKIKILNRYRAI